MIPPLPLHGTGTRLYIGYYCPNIEKSRFEASSGLPMSRLALCLSALLAFTGLPPAPARAADIEAAPILYGKAPADNVVTRLQRRIEIGEVDLDLARQSRDVASSEWVRELAQFRNLPLDLLLEPVEADDQQRPGRSAGCWKPGWMWRDSIFLTERGRNTPERFTGCVGSRAPRAEPWPSFRICRGRRSASAACAAAR